MFDRNRSKDFLIKFEGIFKKNQRKQQHPFSVNKLPRSANKVVRISGSTQLQPGLDKTTIVLHSFLRTNILLNL